jgi:hypothetical protein
MEWVDEEWGTSERDIYGIYSTKDLARWVILSKHEDDQTTYSLEVRKLYE